MSNIILNENGKKPYLSKTIIFNAIVAIAALIPSLRDFVAANPGIILSIISVVGVILRLITKDKIVIGE